jgi:hypothetical protein
MLQSCNDVNLTLKSWLLTVLGTQFKVIVQLSSRLL